MAQLVVICWFTSEKPGIAGSKISPCLGTNNWKSQCSLHACVGSSVPPFGWKEAFESLGFSVNCSLMLLGKGEQGSWGLWTELAFFVFVLCLEDCHLLLWFEALDSAWVEVARGNSA